MTIINIISDTQRLEEKCSAWQNKSYVTIDTEFLRTSTYWSKLCLIQVGHDGEGVLIDPLSSIDLQPLFELLQNPNVVKVFHDARQDAEIFHNIGNFCPSPIFDTQIAAQACGFGDSASYEALVKQLLGKSIDKSARVTDWSKRPLTDRQQHYALSDVTHLCRVYEKLQKRLEKLNRTDWVEPEFAALTEMSYYENPPEKAWCNLRFKANNARQQQMLEIIAAWRETKAQKHDRPRGWILRDDTMRNLMVAAANALPLDQVRGLPKNFKEVELVKQITAAQATLSKKESSKENKNGSRNKNDNKISMLKLLLKIQCERHQVAPKLIANAQQIETFAADCTQPCAIKTGFRYEVFGQWAEALMKGEISLALINGKTQIVKTRPRAQG
jgi:ribonuclease D